MHISAWTLTCPNFVPESDHALQIREACVTNREDIMVMVMVIYLHGGGFMAGPTSSSKRPKPRLQMMSDSALQVSSIRGVVSLPCQLNRDPRREPSLNPKRVLPCTFPLRGMDFFFSQMENTALQKICISWFLGTVHYHATGAWWWPGRGFSISSLPFFFVFAYTRRRKHAGGRKEKKREWFLWRRCHVLPAWESCHPAVMNKPRGRLTDGDGMKKKKKGWKNHSPLPCMYRCSNIWRPVYIMSSWLVS